MKKKSYKIKVIFFFIIKLKQIKINKSSKRGNKNYTIIKLPATKKQALDFLKT